MEKTIAQLTQILSDLIGLHRRLMEAVRIEREALVSADLKGVQDTTLAKEGMIEQIRNLETARLKVMGVLAMAWKKPLRELSLPNVIIAIQGYDPKAAEKLRSSQNALVMLIQRITDQNKENQVLVEKFLGHLNNMKRNVLGEAVPRSNVYTPQGQRASGNPGARLISKEA